MSIMSDRWIHRMATEHKMIEPFEAQQVRETESGGRAISYGLSSYVHDGTQYIMLQTGPKLTAMSLGDF